MQKNKFIRLKDGRIILVTAINSAQHVGHGINLNSPYLKVCNFPLSKVSDMGMRVDDADFIRTRLAKTLMNPFAILPSKVSEARKKGLEKINDVLVLMETSPFIPYVTN